MSEPIDLDGFLQLSADYQRELEDRAHLAEMQRAHDYLAELEAKAKAATAHALNAPNGALQWMIDQEVAEAAWGLSPEFLAELEEQDARERDVTDAMVRIHAAGSGALALEALVGESAAAPYRWLRVVRRWEAKHAPATSA